LPTISSGPRRRQPAHRSGIFSCFKRCVQDAAPESGAVKRQLSTRFGGSAAARQREETEMFGLEQIADGFDQIQAADQKAIDQALRDSAIRAGSDYGPDSWQTYGLAVSAGIAWSLFTFSTTVAKGFVDVLRLGEGVKEGTPSGYLKDGLRVLAVAGPAFKGVRYVSAYAVAGGEYAMSCGVTSNAAALRLSGTRLAITLDDLAQTANLPVSPTSPAFTGLQTVDQLVPTLQQVGASVRQMPMITSAADVAAAAAENRGGVIFGVRWWNAANGSGISTMGSGHIMVAFRSLTGRIMVADQFGVRPIGQLSEMVIGGVRQPASQFTISSGAYVVENTAFVKNLSQLSAATGLKTPMKLAIDMVHLPGPVAQKLDAAIREQLGRPPRDAGGGGSPAPASAAPASAGHKQPLSPTAQKLLAGIPMKSSITPAALRATTGVPAGNFHTALQELEAKNYVTIVRWGADQLNINSIARR